MIKSALHSIASDNSKASLGRIPFSLQILKNVSFIDAGVSITLKSLFIIILIKGNNVSYMFFVVSGLFFSSQYGFLEKYLTKI